MERKRGPLQTKHYNEEPLTKAEWEDLILEEYPNARLLTQTEICQRINGEERLKLYLGGETWLIPAGNIMGGQKLDKGVLLHRAKWEDLNPQYKKVEEVTPDGKQH